MLLLHAGVARKGVPSACVLVLGQEIDIQVPCLAHKINNLSTNMFKSVVPCCSLPSRFNLGLVTFQGKITTSHIDQ